MNNENTYSRVTLDVLDYISVSSPAHLSLSEIAYSRNWNIDHMIRCFKRDMGMTPHKYIALVKADFAINYVNQGMSLQDIAELLGYSSVSSLSASFKNATNRNLSEYKHQSAS